jgi:pyruvate dehydrogenase (quinone)
LFRECSHYCELISNPRQAPRVLRTAMHHAVSKRGVSVIVLSGDIAAMEVPSENSAHGLVTALPTVQPADADLARLADLLNKGQRVALFCGGGCAGAHAEVVALAEKLKAPVGYSFRGKEWIEFDNPCAVGMTGLLGWGAAIEAMHTGMSAVWGARYLRAGAARRFFGSFTGPWPTPCRRRSARRWPTLPGK